MSSKRLLCLFLLVSTGLAACPGGTVFDARFNKCYKFVTQPASFLLAERNCESMGGSLVTVSNAFENTFISGIAAYNESTTQFWTGMNLLYYTDWTWINGDSSKYRNWAAGQPTEDRPCAAIQVKDTLWTTAEYNYAMPYMCQIDPNATPISGCSTMPPIQPATTRMPTTPSTLATTALPGSCPKGYCLDNAYTLNPETCNCFQGVLNGQNYSIAVKICAYNNATLPIILNESDNYFFSIRMNMDFERIWLALYCANTTLNSCTWQDGSSLSYSDFGQGYPLGNQYGFLYNGVWYTTGEENTAAVLCQQKGIATPIPIPEPTPCPNGHCPDSSYILNPASCKCYMYFQNTQMTYSEAKGYCSENNSTLAIILNETDNQFITNYTLASGANDPWIGAYCRTNAVNSCRWENGSPFGYENFRGGPQADEYVYIRYGGWYTGPAYWNQGCLCQQMGIP